MTTVLEKMARALAMSDGYSEKEINASLGDPRLDVMPLYTDQARAALQAIRVPGLAEWAALGPTQCETVGQVRTAYTAMIDAILNEKKA